jgi:hypothetical protein
MKRIREGAPPLHLGTRSMFKETILCWELPAHSRYLTKLPSPLLPTYTQSSGLCFQAVVALQPAWTWNGSTSSILERRQRCMLKVKIDYLDFAMVLQ